MYYRRLTALILPLILFVVFGSYLAMPVSSSESFCAVGQERLNSHFSECAEPDGCNPLEMLSDLMDKGYLLDPFVCKDTVRNFFSSLVDSEERFDPDLSPVAAWLFAKRYFPGKSDIAVLKNIESALSSKSTGAGTDADEIDGSDEVVALRIKSVLSRSKDPLFVHTLSRIVALASPENKALAAGYLKSIFEHIISSGFAARISAPEYVSVDKELASYSVIIDGKKISGGIDSLVSVVSANAGVYKARFPGNLVSSVFTTLLGRDYSKSQIFRLTYYILAEETKHSRGSKWMNLRGVGNKVIAKVSRSFYRMIAMQGSGILEDGRILSWARPYRYSIVNRSIYPFGRGAARIPVVPFRTLAVDRTRIALGTILYIPEFDGLRLRNGTKHDGCFVAGDTGGRIKGARLDLFAYTEEDKNHILASLPNEHYRVYPGGAKCKSSYDLADTLSEKRLLVLNSDSGFKAVDAVLK